MQGTVKLLPTLRYFGSQGRGPGNEEPGPVVEQLDTQVQIYSYYLQMCRWRRNSDHLFRFNNLKQTYYLKHEPTNSVFIITGCASEHTPSSHSPSSDGNISSILGSAVAKIRHWD